MLTRWFQFGVWTPVYRVHGGGSNTGKQSNTTHQHATKLCASCLDRDLELWQDGDDECEQHAQLEVQAAAIHL